MDDYLNDIRRETSPKDDPIEHAETPATPGVGLSEKDVDMGGQGIFGRWEIAGEKQKFEMAKARKIYETKLNMLGHQAVAAERESKAFWDSKSAELAEVMRSYVQESMRSLEIDRGHSRSQAMNRATELLGENMRQAWEMNVPEIMKKNLMTRLQTEFDETIDRIAKDHMADKYGLK